MKKYRLTNETITITQQGGTDITLHRIEALRDFANVKAGDKGGYVESEDNLSHRGDCWVYGDAKVFGSARVCGSAEVCGDKRVCDCTLLRN